jgi:hypothetical protein
VAADLSNYVDINEMMKNGEKVLIWCADGRKGGSVGKEKYEMVRDFIISFVRERRRVTFPALLEEAKRFMASFDVHEDETSFLVIKVKGDLEARGIIRKQWLLGRQQVITLRRRSIR